VRLPTTPPPSDSPPQPPVRLLELVILAVLSAAGILLRTWHFGDAALSHFDEGVYAFTGLGLADSEQPFRMFPEQQKFSPPLYVALVALVNLFGIDPARSPLVVNVVIGSLTIPVVWWVTRRWFGAAAAVGAAALVALSEFHIILSRSALTDATFALTFLVALAAMLSAIDRLTPRAAIVAGLCVGLAWNTKYHGWFALVVGAMVIAGRWRLQGAGNAWFGRAVRVWIAAAVVAGLCYLPWALFIQTQPGSSAGWASYFATMLQLDWFGSFWRHVQQQQYVEGPWSRASVPLALLSAQIVAAANGRRLAPWWAPVVLGLGALLVGASGVAVALTVVALVQRWREGMRGPDWLIAAVVVLWVVMAPVYHPYFRLLMPFTVATYMMAATQLAKNSAVASSASPMKALGAAVVATAVTAAVALRLPDPSDPWRPLPGLASAAAILDQHIPPGVPVRVMGEPALALHLHQRGHASFKRTYLDSLDGGTDPVYLVTGIYLRRSPQPRARFEERRERMEPLARVPLGAPSDIRVLDDFTPDSARRWMQHRDTTYDLLLFRYRPTGARER
jgi:4-amino-4-deoxy-L-arabinose transferase-like glycosyltransferase